MLARALYYNTWTPTGPPFNRYMCIIYDEIERARIDLRGPSVHCNHNNFSQPQTLATWRTGTTAATES